MRFKHNPWVSLLAALVLTIIIVFFCTGCATEAEENARSRFTVEFARHFNGADQLYIITDTETGVQYLLADVYNGAGLTKLEG